MNASKFDRLAKTLAKGASRRRLLAAAGALALGKGQVSLAAQLAPSTCAAAGEVCTLMRGCCDALTCVTSAINTNYGVCVPGEGGTVSIGTTLISPFSEEVEQEVAALANGATTTDTSTTTTTTDLEAEREQRIAEKKARKDDRRDDKRLRQDTHKDELQDRRDDRKLNREERRGPRLAIDLFNAGGIDPVETVRVTNRDDVDIILNKIDSLPPPGHGTEITNGYRLEPGNSFLFLSESEGTLPSIDGNRLRWSPPSPICSSSVPDDGFLITAASSSDSENHEFTILCDGSTGGGNGKNPRRKKRKRKAGRGGKGGKSRNKNG
ncbi:MAG: hypothetical protein ACRDJC_13080 [Thermomicrobiales bacterium]